MGRIRIQEKSGLAYISEELRKKGFTGDVETLENAITVTLVKPGTPTEQIEHSLEIMLDDIRLRLGKSKLREVLREP